MQRAEVIRTASERPDPPGLDERQLTCRPRERSSLGLTASAAESIEQERRRVAGPCFAQRRYRSMRRTGSSRWLAKLIGAPSLKTAARVDEPPVRSLGAPRLAIAFVTEHSPAGWRPDAEPVIEGEPRAP